MVLAVGNWPLAGLYFTRIIHPFKGIENRSSF